MVHQQHLQLVGAIIKGQRGGAALVLGGGDGAGEAGVHPGVFVAFDHIAGGVVAHHHDLLHLGLGLPPVGVGLQPQVVGRLKGGDHIRAGARGIVALHIGGGEHREGHGVEQTPVLAGRLDHHGIVILGGNAGDEVVQVGIEALVGGILILSAPEDVLGGGNHVVCGQGRAVGEGHVLPQVEGPGLAAAALLPAFGQAGLGEVVVVNGDQAVVEQVVDAHHVPLLGIQRADGRGLGGLNAHHQAVLHVAGLSGGQTAQQTQAQGQRCRSPHCSG